MNYIIQIIQEEVVKIELTIFKQKGVANCGLHTKTKSLIQYSNEMQSLNKMSNDSVLLLNNNFIFDQFANDTPPITKTNSTPKNREQLTSAVAKKSKSFSINNKFETQTTYQNVKAFQSQDTILQGIIQQQQQQQTKRKYKIQQENFNVLDSQTYIQGITSPTTTTTNTINTQKNQYNTVFKSKKLPGITRPYSPEQRVKGNEVEYYQPIVYYIPAGQGQQQGYMQVPIIYDKVPVVVNEVGNSQQEDEQKRVKGIRSRTSIRRRQQQQYQQVRPSELLLSQDQEYYQQQQQQQQQQVYIQNNSKRSISSGYYIGKNNINRIKQQKVFLEELEINEQQKLLLMQQNQKIQKIQKELLIKEEKWKMKEETLMNMIQQLSQITKQTHQLINRTQQQENINEQASGGVQRDYSNSSHISSTYSNSIYNYESDTIYKSNSIQQQQQQQSNNILRKQRNIMLYQQQQNYKEIGISTEMKAIKSQICQVGESLLIDINSNSNQIRNPITREIVTQTSLIFSNNNKQLKKFIEAPEIKIHTVSDEGCSERIKIFQNLSKSQKNEEKKNDEENNNQKIKKIAQVFQVPKPLKKVIEIKQQQQKQEENLEQIDNLCTEYLTQLYQEILDIQIQDTNEVEQQQQEIKQKKIQNEDQQQIKVNNNNNNLLFSNENETFNNSQCFYSSEQKSEQTEGGNMIGSTPFKQIQHYWDRRDSSQTRMTANFGEISGNTSLQDLLIQSSDVKEKMNLINLIQRSEDKSEYLFQEEQEEDEEEEEKQSKKIFQGNNNNNNQQQLQNILDQQQQQQQQQQQEVIFSYSSIIVEEDNNNNNNNGNIVCSNIDIQEKQQENYQQKQQQIDEKIIYIRFDVNKLTIEELKELYQYKLHVGKFIKVLLKADSTTLINVQIIKNLKYQNQSTEDNTNTNSNNKLEFGNYRQLIKGEKYVISHCEDQTGMWLHGIKKEDFSVYKKQNVNPPSHKFITLPSYYVKLSQVQRLYQSLESLNIQVKCIYPCFAVNSFDAFVNSNTEYSDKFNSFKYGEILIVLQTNNQLLLNHKEQFIHQWCYGFKINTKKIIVKLIPTKFIKILPVFKM